MSLSEINYGSSINIVANVIEFPSNCTRILITEPEQAWYEKAVEQLEELVKLKTGWDGYQGLPVSFENATFALRIMESICRNDTQPPQIVPGVSGDLQIEWHTMQGDIELHVKAPNDVRAWHSPLSNYIGEEELNLTFDFTDVAGWVKIVVEKPIVVDTAVA